MDNLEYSVVSEKQAKSTPYPYIYINHDGTFRELTREECQYLETKFHPNDGSRPYVKRYYGDKTPDGRLHDFLLRKKYQEFQITGISKKPLLDRILDLLFDTKE